jgi:hypothetical protein
MDAIKELSELRTTVLESVERVAGVSLETGEQNEADIKRRIKLLMDIKAAILRFEILESATRS